EAVTKPASAPVSRATTALDFLCRSSISTHSVAISAMAWIASGPMIEAPSAVIVPETLTIWRSPRRERMSELRRRGVSIGQVLSEMRRPEAGEEGGKAGMRRGIGQQVGGRTFGGNAAVVHE